MIELEKQTVDFLKELEAKGGKPVNELTPAEARKFLEDVQAQPFENPHVDVQHLNIPGPDGTISVKLVRPVNSKEKLPIILFIHGAGWVMGSANTHDHFVREISTLSNAAVAFVNYSLSPEAKFPKASDESYAALKHIVEHAEELDLDSERLAVAGDSVGGNMAIALTLLAKEKNGPKIKYQALFYPVTNADLNSESYQKFADGPWLTKASMEYFWKAYTTKDTDLHHPLVSPLHASVEKLKGLPPALVITAENDVLRDEGEGYIKKLKEAGVPVRAIRMAKTMHDFMMLNALAETTSTRMAFKIAGDFFQEVFHNQPCKFIERK